MKKPNPNNTQEIREATCLLLEEIQDIAGSLWGDVQYYGSKPTYSLYGSVLSLKQRIDKLWKEFQRDGGII